ncbi:NAD(P)H quinone oxidoreductase [Enterococcus durans]|uniref:NAD(P)H quinone oxidoreductase n=1 Tax=Enterococcus durans TaxID=53345 RepID=A0A377KKX1_9ENTE|nr:zinc-binding dehydrogenase [Enterococcus durans]STP29819.1 NAD(P)H quinone oxidoreductase [Enterococcus durans]
MMKAVVLDELGNLASLNYKEVGVPSPEEGEVVVKLRAAAVNRRELMIAKGQYQGARAPIILGSDGAGEVYSLGNLVKSFSVGDQVIINPGLNWGKDNNKKNVDFSILGMPQNGTYAEYVKVPVENIVEKPAHLSWEEAASLPLAGLTAYRALVTKGKIQKGEKVLIPGAGGGVATFLIQFAHVLGAEVYVTSSKEDKINKAMELGAVGGVNYTEENWVEQLLELTGGIDLSIDSVGGDSFKSLITLGKIGSRIVNFGSTRGPINNLFLPSLTLKEISIIGSTMGSMDDFSKMIKLVNEKEIHPGIDRVYSLREVNKALERIEKGQNFGKIVLTMDEI